MKFNIKKTTLLLIISILLLLVLIFFNIYVVIQFSHFKHEANIINSAGKIRGNIQRAVKKTMFGVSADDSIKLVNDFFYNFKNKKTGFVITSSEKLFYKELEIFSDEWELLNLYLEQYHEMKTDDIKNMILEKSEICWILSNKLVYLTQKYYEEKLIFFNFVIFGNAFTIFGMSLIIIITRGHVQLKLERMANYDGLTNAMNRYAFNRYMSNELYKKQRYNLQFALIIFDIDYFKSINDNFGHKTGDIILKKVVEISFSIIRKTDYLFRIGGEEFCIILSNSNLDSGIIVANKIRTTIESYDFIHKNRVTVSFGVAEPIDNESSDSLFKRADNCLYSAKNAGRNQVWASKQKDDCFLVE